MRYFFNILPWLFLVFVPATAMRVFAEEKRTNTLEVLLTLPLSELMIVVAKFTALLIFNIIVLILTLSIPIGLMFISAPNLTEILVAYIGAILLVSFSTAISLFFSSLTKNQIIAFLSSAILLFVLTVLGTEFFNSFIPSLIQPYLVLFSPMYHYESFLKGLIDFRSIIYFFTLTSVFIFLTVINIERRD